MHLLSLDEMVLLLHRRLSLAGMYGACSGCIFNNLRAAWCLSAADYKPHASPGSNTTSDSQSSSMRFLIVLNVELGL